MEAIVLEEREVAERVIHVDIQWLVNSVSDRIDLCGFAARSPFMEREHIFVGLVPLIPLHKGYRKDGLIRAEHDVDDVEGIREDPFLFELL